MGLMMREIDGEDKRYLQMKDDTRRLICRTLYEHNGMVMQELKEDGK